MTYAIKKGTTLPVLQATLMKSDKSLLNLTTATSVVFRFALAGSGKVNALPATIIDAATGEVEVAFPLSATKFAGDCEGEFVVTFQNGEILGIPNDGNIEFTIAAPPGSV